MHQLSQDDLQRTVDLHDQYGRDGAMEALGKCKSTINERLAQARAKGIVPGGGERPFQVEDLPKELPPTEDIVERRKEQFKHKRAAKEARKLIDVKVTIDGPFGVAHMGDPHVDDDGTDIGLLERHGDIINATEGLFAANVGDHQNNWIGRLARLWAQQSTSAAEAWALVEWHLRRNQWIYLINGNHDCWSGAGDPVSWMMRQQPGVFENHGARLSLQTPSGREFRINARHDFKGYSQWNTAHGPARAAQQGWRDHVLACGHLHISGYQVVKCPMSSLISHIMRIASYKIFDRFADEKGLPDQNIFMCPVTIFDPDYGDDDPRAVTTLFDPEEAAEYLTWKRSKWEQGKRHD
ncbi:MAG: hypothetical protein AAF441_21310 [Pseudomonadota bacterium]